MDVLIGFVIALVIALTGVGAGVITAPLLILFLHVPVETAVSTALAYSAVVKLIVVPAQIARRQVSWHVLKYMLVGGLPGVIAGSFFFRHVARTGPSYALYFVLGVIILFTSGWHLFRYFHPSGISRPTVEGPWSVAAIMLPVGAEVGFSSSGAGALGTVALLGLTGLPAAQVVGTDLAFGLCIALAGTGVHLLGGSYLGPLLLKLAIGGILGGIAGTIAAPRIPNRQLRLALSLWLIIIGAQFCFEAAKDWLLHSPPQPLQKEVTRLLEPTRMNRGSNLTQGSGVRPRSTRKLIADLKAGGLDPAGGELEYAGSPETKSADAPGRYRGPGPSDAHRTVECNHIDSEAHAEGVYPGGGSDQQAFIHTEAGASQQTDQSRKEAVSESYAARDWLSLGFIMDDIAFHECTVRVGLNEH